MHNPENPRAPFQRIPEASLPVARQTFIDISPGRARIRGDWWRFVAIPGDPHAMAGKPG